MRSEVDIEILARNGATVLRKAYCTQPFKVMNITEDARGGVLRLMMMSSSPGILDGDNYHIDIDLGQDSRVALRTQSYQRLFSMTKGATQHTRINLQQGASFNFLPHPVVPHESAIFFSTNKIFLAANCSLIWGEVVTCGRKESGESFRFTSYHALTEIFLSGRLVIKENLLMQPASANLADIGQLEGFTHQATMIFLHETFLVKELIDAVAGFLNTINNIVYGITAAPINGIVIRMFGNKAEDLYHCLHKIADLIERLKPLPDQLFIQQETIK